MTNHRRLSFWFALPPDLPEERLAQVLTEIDAVIASTQLYVEGQVRHLNSYKNLPQIHLTQEKA